MTLLLLDAPTGTASPHSIIHVMTCRSPVYFAYLPSFLGFIKSLCIMSILMLIMHNTSFILPVRAIRNIIPLPVRAIRNIIPLPVRAIRNIIPLPVRAIRNIIPLPVRAIRNIIPPLPVRAIRNIIPTLPIRNIIPTLPVRAIHNNNNIKIPYVKHSTWPTQIQNATVLDSKIINKSKPYPFFLEFFIKTIFNFTRAFTWFHHSENVTNRCKLVNMCLRRNLYRRHDFIVYIQSISSPRTLCDCSYIFSLFISYHISTLEQFASLLHNIPLYKIFSDTQQSLVGGGTNLFSFAELQPDISNNNNLKTSKFRFCEYSLKANTSTLDQSLIAIDHPLHLLLPKLPVSDLKLIALSHGIYTHTKMRRDQIQTTIIDHTCHNCGSYVSIFEVVV